MTSTGSARAPSCTNTADELAEPLAASAGVARAWLLIEHPGPWKRDPFAAGFDQEVRAELERRAAGSAVKILAIRRGDGAGAHRRRVIVAHCGPGQAWLATSTVVREQELLDLDMEAVAEGRTPEQLEPLTVSLYLVCTHAGRDACCGRLGRPLADQLGTVHPGRVWECSHLGGHRFAANLVCLPHGVLYGRVDLAAGDGPRLAERYEKSRLDLDHLRGMSWQAPPVQAADLFVRRHTGLLAVDDVEPVATTDMGDGLWLVEMRTPGTPAGSWEAHVRHVPTGQPRPFSCSTEELEDPGRWELVDLRSGP
ncbi:MAG: sucrase ferredoxin [Acidimicrobiales bacterium]